MPARFRCLWCMQERNVLSADGTPRRRPCGHCVVCCPGELCSRTYQPQTSYSQIDSAPPVNINTADTPVRAETRHTPFNVVMMPERMCSNPACNSFLYDQQFVYANKPSLGSVSVPSCPKCGASQYNSPKTSARDEQRKLVKDDTGKIKMVNKWDGPVATKDNVPFAYIPKKTQLKINPSPRLIGVEMEIDTYQYGEDIDRVVRDLKGGNYHDGTAGSGLEINTAPAGGDLFYENTRKLSEGLRDAGAKCGRKWGRSGLHVHIDARDVYYADLRKIIILYAKVEPALFSIIDPYRAAYGGANAGTNYCRPMGQGVFEALRDPATARSDIVDIVCSKSWLAKNKGKPITVKVPPGSERYKALNLWSWWMRGTLEFRLHHGTTKWQKVVPWGMLLCGIVDTAIRITEKELWAWPEGKAGLMKLAPNTSLDFSSKTMAMENEAAGKQVWDPKKDGVRQWVQHRWDYFAAKRKNKSKPMISSIDP